MNSILAELVKSGILLWMLAYLLRNTFKYKAGNIKGWYFILAGIALLLSGSLAAIVSQYLRHNEPFLALDSGPLVHLENIGYVSGLALLALGLFRWIPGVLDAAVIKENTRNNAVLQQVIDLLPGFISAKDEHGQLLFANKALTDTYGINTAALSSKSKSSLLANKEIIQSLSDSEVSLLRSGEQKLVHQEKIIDKDGNTRLLQTIKTPYQVAETNAPALLFISVDITDSRLFEIQRAKLNKKLIEIRKPHAHDELTVSIGHDFASALSGIMLAARLLQKPERNLDARGLEFVDLIVSTSQRAIDLANKSAAYTKQNDEQPKMVDIVGIVQHAAALLDGELEQQVSISTKKQKKNSTVIGNSSALLNLFVQLGLNTADLVRNEGKISFVLSYKQLSQAFCDASSFDITPGDFLEIVLHNTASHALRLDDQIIFNPGDGQHEQIKLERLESLKIVIREHKGALEDNGNEQTDAIFCVYLPLLINQP